jgi:hypothetical protein
VNDIGEFDYILDEKDGDIIAHNIPVALISVKLNGKSSDVSHGVSTTTTSLVGGKANEDWSFP